MAAGSTERDGAAAEEHGPRLELAAGARATEELLLAHLGALRAESRARPQLLARPVRVLVPSSALRLHVSERIARRLGGTAGVVVQTLQGLAREVLARAGRSSPEGEARVELLTARAARRERTLRDELDDFRDGYRGVVAAVADLLDAGFAPELLEGLEELLEEAPLSHRDRRRARAVLRVAGAVSLALAEDPDARGEGSLASPRSGRSGTLGAAAELVRADGDALLPTRLLLVHGFADVTGRAKDLLLALVQHAPARVLLDLPRDPADAGRPDRGVAFTARLREGLEGVLGRGRAHEDAPAPAADAPPRAFVAPDADVEAREVAHRIGALLDAGAVPERIGIVARDLGPYASPLRRHLDALGVPFAARRARAPLDGPGRRVHAALQLLGEGAACPVQRWLDARAPAGAVHDLDLALRAGGALRLADVVALTSRAGKDLALPARRGVSEEGGAGWHAPRRRLPAEELARAGADAQALTTLLAERPDAATARAHADHAERVLEALGWGDEEGDPARGRTRPVLERLAGDLGEEPLAADEFLALLERALPPAAAPPLAARAADPAAEGGAGVQVLDAMEARARTFEHLFVLGLNRDVFPRTISPDPVLADEARRQLAQLLPDVPVKARGRDEDRYLFAQLVSAAEHVTLSWRARDADDKQRSPSPLVERLDHATLQVERARPLVPHRPEPEDLARPRTAHERLVLASLLGGSAALAEHLAGIDASTDADAESAVGSARADLARRVVDAFEEGRREPRRLAPWLGFLGPLGRVGGRQDPAREPLYVTTLERQARCPWQAFLTSVLRLEPMPDPRADLPGVDPRVLGTVVHGVLARIDGLAVDGDPTPLEAVLRRAPAAVRWPEPARLDALVLEEARREVARTPTPLPGLAHVYAACARPYVEAARAFVTDGVLGVEVDGWADLADGARVRFRADRVERRGDELVLSDYKTGRTATTKRKLLGGQLARGSHLQPAAYLVGARGLAPEGASVRARFLYLGAAPEEAEVSLGGASGGADEEREAGALLAASVETLLDGWRAGTFFPRLVSPGGEREPDACAHCDVRQACLIGDSGARRALLAWAEGEGTPEEEGAPLRALWQLAPGGAGR